jgi:hypothetical protein
LPITDPAATFEIRNLMLEGAVLAFSASKGTFVSKVDVAPPIFHLTKKILD